MNHRQPRLRSSGSPRWGMTAQPVEMPFSRIAVGNYVSVSQHWPNLLDRANELLNEIYNTQSRRWG